MVIQVGNVVPGAKLLNKDDRGVNETFIGFVDVPAGRVRAYVKVMDNRQLVNELLATTLGRSLGLPVPEGYLVRVRPSDLPDSNLLAMHGTEALAFASREVSSPDLKRRVKAEGTAVIAALLTAWDDWTSAMTFDEWVANGDRHAGNILFGGPGDIWLIDHSHCFTGPNWNISDLKANGVWKNQIAENRLPTLTLPERLEAKRRVAALISALGAIDCGSALSASRADAFLPPVDAGALGTFVTSRVSHLYDILSNRLGIPNLGGAA